MKECIICREKKSDDKFNVEHIIPESLGGKLKIQNVCEKCNSISGRKIDKYLTNNIISEMSRFNLGIVGKSRKLPNPFKEGTLVGGEGESVICDEKLQPTVNTFVKAEKELNEFTIIADSEEKVYNIIRKKMKRLGRDNITDEEISAMIIKIDEEHFKPKIKYSSVLKLNLIELAIIKIAYELSYYWLGEAYLSDSQSIKISSILFSYITEDKIINTEEIIGIIPTSLSSTLNTKCIENVFGKSLSNEDLNSLHIMVLQVKDERLYCCVSIFGDFNYWVLVSEKASEYLDNDKALIIIPRNGEFIEK